MTAPDIAILRLMVEEGFRAELYWDERGNPTIGYGFNLLAGITPYAARALLEAQVDELNVSLSEFPWYAGMDPVRQSVPLDMAINMGLNGVLEFTHMIAAIERGDWPSAQTALLDSEAARELPERYKDLGLILLTGQEIPP
jgi:lysozyme